MSVETCQRCNGRGWICPKCGKPHPRKADGWGFGRRCYSRARSIPCPGFTPPAESTGLYVPKTIPHFATRSRCDVCALERPGEVSGAYLRATKPDWGVWVLSNDFAPGKWLVFCPCCALRVHELRTTVFDRLVEERGQVHAGRVAGGLVRLEVIR